MVIFSHIKKYIKKMWCIMHHHFCSYDENVMFSMEIEGHVFKFYQCPLCDVRYFGCKDSAYDTLISEENFKLHFIPIFNEWINDHPKRLPSWYISKLEYVCEINRLQYRIFFGDMK